MNLIVEKLDELLTEVKLLREQTIPAREIMSVPEAAERWNKSVSTQLHNWSSQENSGNILSPYEYFR